MKYFKTRQEAREEGQRQRQELADRLALRVPGLAKAFDGAIKYTPLLTDHPDWTDEECLKFAKMWHKIAIQRLKDKVPAWNNGIPYCRNLPTQAMLDEAG